MNIQEYPRVSKQYMYLHVDLPQSFPVSVEVVQLYQVCHQKKVE